MVDKWYKETERLIAGYWHIKDRISRLEAVESAILDSLNTLTKELAAVNSVPSYIAKYGVTPPGARGQDKDLSDMMVQIEKQVDKLSAEVVAKLKRLSSIRSRLRRAQEMLAPMEIIMARLTQEERKITEYRYVHRWSFWVIGDQLHCSKTRAHYIHHTVINKVAAWLGKTR